MILLRLQPSFRWFLGFRNHPQCVEFPEGKAWFGGGDLSIAREVQLQLLIAKGNAQLSDQNLEGAAAAACEAATGC